MNFCISLRMAATSLVLLGATALSTPALAQSGDVAAQRQAVFQQLQTDPANRELMRAYARLSVQMRDFEAAVSTLERLLDLEPDNTAARVELAVAYFALGAYAVAEYHLTAAEASGGLTPEQVAQVARYRAEAEERGDGSEYSGRVAVGYAWTDSAGDSGAFVSGSLDWRIDLGDAHVTQWVTEFAFATYDPEDGSLNGRSNGRLRTGPEFRLSRDAYGARLQPYVEFGWQRRDVFLNDDFNSWAVGLAYANPLNERFTVYADLALGREMAVNGTFGDYDFHEADLGVTYRPSRDTRFRLSGTLGERRQIDVTFPTTTTEASVRLTAQHAFDPGFQDLPNRWIVGGFAEVAQLNEGTGFFFDADTDRESYGLWMRAFVFEDIYVEAAASQITEQVSFGSFTSPATDETVYSLQIGWEF